MANAKHHYRAHRITMLIPSRLEFPLMFFSFNEQLCIWARRRRAGLQNFCNIVVINTIDDDRPTKPAKRIKIHSNKSNRQYERNTQPYVELAESIALRKSFPVLGVSAENFEK